MPPRVEFYYLCCPLYLVGWLPISFTPRPNSPVTSKGHFTVPYYFCLAKRYWFLDISFYAAKSESFGKNVFQLVCSLYLAMLVIDCPLITLRISMQKSNCKISYFHLKCRILEEYIDCQHTQGICGEVRQDFPLEAFDVNIKRILFHNLSFSCYLWDCYSKNHQKWPVIAKLKLLILAFNCDGCWSSVILPLLCKLFKIVTF